MMAIGVSTPFMGRLNNETSSLLPRQCGQSCHPGSADRRRTDRYLQKRARCARDLAEW